MRGRVVSASDAPLLIAAVPVSGFLFKREGGRESFEVARKEMCERIRVLAESQGVEKDLISARKKELGGVC